MNFILLIVFATTSAFPISWIHSLDDPSIISEFDNFLFDTKDLEKYKYDNPLEDNDGSQYIIDLRKPTKSSKRNPKTLKTMADVLVEGAIGGIELVDDFFTSFPHKQEETTESTLEEIHETTQAEESAVAATTVIPETSTLKIVSLQENETSADGKLRQGRQDEQQDDNESENKTVEPTTDDPREPRQDDGSSEEVDDNNGGGITALISAFLGSLSRPDGGIDLDAIVGLLGGLSTQNDDGTYDFAGLTDLLMSFFGGGEEGGGGSDIGKFLGGLLGAFIKGVANPPGAKGAGIFTGNVLTGILPALSGPAPTAEDTKPPPALDSGGFLSGLLGTILGPFSSASSAGGGAGNGGYKFSLFKSFFSIITSILTASSSSKN